MTPPVLTLTATASSSFQAVASALEDGRRLKRDKGDKDDKGDKGDKDDSADREFDASDVSHMDHDVEGSADVGGISTSDTLDGTADETTLAVEPAADTTGEGAEDAPIETGESTGIEEFWEVSTTDTLDSIEEEDTLDMVGEGEESLGEVSVAEDTYAWDIMEPVDEASAPELLDDPDGRVSISSDEVGLYFACRPGPCEGTLDDEDLELLETAVHEHMTEGRVMQSSVEFDLQTLDGVKFRGVDFEVSLPIMDERRLEAKDRRRKGLNLRRRVQANGDSGVLVKTSVDFTAPPNLGPDDIFTTSQLTKLLSNLLEREESGIVGRIQTTNTQGSWLSQVVGYQTMTESNFANRLKAEQTEFGISVQDATLPGGDVTLPGEDVMLPGAPSVALPSEATTADAPALASAPLSDGRSNSSLSSLLIIGAAGAGASLLLLVGLLCYARSSKSRIKNIQLDTSPAFEPGKNNPRSPSASSSSRRRSLFKKKNSDVVEPDGNEGTSATASPASQRDADVEAALETQSDQFDVEEDDESFMMARAALGQNDNVTVATNAHTNGDDMSYAFTVDGESIMPTVGHASVSASEDAMIGAGGLTSFANDKGVFRWNESGTKMVYTPATAANNSEQNGFVFDERKKRWVVKDKVVGEKGVSFKATTQVREEVLAGEPAIRIVRSRSADSEGTGISGISEFTYDNVALETRRTRSGNTLASITDSVRGGGGDVSSMPSPPRTPGGTPKDEGVEVDDQFRPDSSLMNDDDTAFTGWTQGTVFPAPVTPDRADWAFADDETVVTTTTRGTLGTIEPGRIVPKSSVKRPNQFQIKEDSTFEWTPFDESSKGPARQSSNDGGEDDHSAHSEEVLQDLDRLSKFMKERRKAKNDAAQKSKSFRNPKRLSSRAPSFGNKSEYAETMRGV